MDNNNFDHRLKSSLDNLEVPYDASNWDLLSSRLDIMDTVGQSSMVDNAMRGSLNRLEAPYESSHWDLMAQKLAEQTRLRRRIWIGKLAEAAVFLLLIANINSFLQDTRSFGPSQKQMNATEPVAATHSRSGGADKHPVQGAAADKLQTSSETVSQEAVKNPLQIVEALAYSAMQSRGNATPAVNQGNPVADTHTTGNVPNNLHPDFPSAEKRYNAADKMLTNNAFAALTPVLPGNSYKLLDRMPEKLALPFFEPILKPVKQHNFYAGIYASADKNTTQVSAYSDASQDHSAGIVAGYRKGKWGIEAGLGYARKRFTPKKQVEILAGDVNNGYYGVYTSKVDADVATMPLRVTRRLGKIKRFSAHALVGATANLAMAKSFHHKTVYYPGFGPSTQPNTNPPAVPVSAKGFMEGGNLNENLFVTADAGVRLEMKAGKRYIIYIEPSYHQAIGTKGFGPKPSQTNAVVLQAGVLAGI